jgi:hypothetical protein
MKRPGKVMSMTIIHHPATLVQSRLSLVGPPPKTAMSQDEREGGVALASIEASLRRAGQSLWKAACNVNGGVLLIARTETLGFTQDELERSLCSIQRAAVMVENLARKFQNDD